MPTKTPENEINLDWAKSGSWDDYQNELDRVLKKADGDPPAPAADVSSRASMLTQPPAPTHTPGVLDQVKNWGNQAAGSLGSMWDGMPTWGRGALIGGGIGALGGMLSDKRKGRGLMQGAMLGAGLGAAGGYLYNQFGGAGASNKGGNEPDEGPSVAQRAKGMIHNAARDALSTAGTATLGSPVVAGGTTGAGYLLNQSGKQNVHEAGTPLPENLRYPNKDVTWAAPSQDIAMTTLQSNRNGELNRVIESLAAGKPGSGIGAYRIPADALANNPQLAAVAQKNVENYLAKQPLPEIDANAFEKLVGRLTPDNQQAAYTVPLNNGKSIDIPFQELTSTMGPKGLEPIAINAANPMANRNELLANAQRYLNQNYQRPQITANDLLGQIKSLQPGGVVQLGGANVPVDTILDASTHADPVKQLVQKLTAQHAANNPVSAATPQQIENALFKLKTQQEGPLDLQVGNKSINPTRQELLAEHGNQLQAQHQRPLEPVEAIKSRLGLRRLGGKALMGIGLGGLADYGLEATGWRPNQADFATRVGNIPGTPEGLAQAVNQTSGLSTKNILDGLQKLNWTPEQKLQFAELLKQKNAR